MFYLNDGINIYPDFLKGSIRNDKEDKVINVSEDKDKTLLELLEYRNTNLYLTYEDFIDLRLNSFKLYGDYSDDAYWHLYHVIYHQLSFLSIIEGYSFKHKLMDRETLLARVNKNPLSVEENIIIPFELQLADYLNGKDKDFEYGLRYLLSKCYPDKEFKEMLSQVEIDKYLNSFFNLPIEDSLNAALMGKALHLGISYILVSLLIHTQDYREYLKKQ